MRKVLILIPLLLIISAHPVKAAENPCPEGKYLDLSDSTQTCRDLIYPERGFDRGEFERSVGSRVYELPAGDCTSDHLQEVLDNVRDGGGIVKLPACEIVVDKIIHLPSNIVLEGAGVGKTIFRRTGYDNDVLRFKHKKNIIYRDFTIDGEYRDGILINNSFSDNILGERLELYNATRVGFHFRYSTRGTLRYSDVSSVQHGWGSKDCFVEGGAENNGCYSEAVGRSDTGSFDPGQLYSESYSVYSNDLHDSHGLGVDSHANVGEVAGNHIYRTSGSKFPDASGVLIHHNKLEDNVGTYASRTYKIYNNPDSIIWWENKFINSIGMPENPLLRTDVNSTNIYLIDNTYRDNRNTTIANDGETYICRGTQDDTVLEVASEYYNDLIYATDSFCDDFPERGGDGRPVGSSGDYDNDGDVDGYDHHLFFNRSGKGPPSIFEYNGLVSSYGS